MAQTVEQGFTTFLGRLTPTDAQRAAGAPHRESVKDALSSYVKVKTFYETGSFSHGTGVRGFSDIDALVSIGNPKPDSSDTALSWVETALSTRFPRTTVRISRPAVVVEFAGGYETWEIIPGFITARGTADQYVYDIPGPAGGWIDSAPRTHLQYVNDCNTRPSSGKAKALARLVKSWKYYCNVPISSFYLEMRAAQHVSAQSSYIHVWDICQLLEKMQGHQLAAMNDPSGASGRFNACSSDAKKKDALSKLQTASTRARKALDADQAGKSSDAFYYLNLVFGGSFPAY